jgi:DNA-binding CsgD family transcriptional regulator/glucose-6-phosphate-specific signal transduction histidine kinase
MLQDGAAAAEAMQSVRRSTRALLAESRELLTALRAAEQFSPATPAPDLRDIRALVEASEGMGEVELHVPDPLPEVTPLVGFTVYRTIQEALTNARLHATGADVVIEVTTTPETIEVAVRNGPPDSAYARVFQTSRPEEGRGFGLHELDQQAGQVGGVVKSAATPDGGFVVQATLPRITRSAPPNPGLRDLTKREVEVIKLVAAGLTNAEIAVHLTVSPLTVKTHVNRAMVKLGLHDKSQLVVLAYREGLASVL